MYIRHNFFFFKTTRLFKRKEISLLNSKSATLKMSNAFGLSHGSQNENEQAFEQSHDSQKRHHISVEVLFDIWCNCGKLLQFHLFIHTTTTTLNSCFFIIVFLTSSMLLLHCNLNPTAIRWTIRYVSKTKAHAFVRGMPFPWVLYIHIEWFEHPLSKSK